MCSARPARSATRLVLVAFLLTIAGATALAIDVVPWQDAAEHAGEVVTVEGDVVAARVERGSCVLEFAPEQADAFRVVLVIPMFTDLPSHPERLYQGRRVRATGKVSRFMGRAEMVLRTPDAIEVIDVAGAPGQPPAPPPAPAATAPAPTPPATLPTAPTPEPTAPAATIPPAAPAPAAPAAPAIPPAPVPSAPTPVVPAAPATPPAPPTAQPVPAPATPPATAPAPAVAPPSPALPAPTTVPPAPTAVPQTVPAAPVPAPTTTLPPAEEEEEESLRWPVIDPCERARTRWREAAARTDALASALRACLGRGTYQCRRDAAALAPALTELEWAEQQVEAACP